ncbi:high-affinity choline transporter 1 [Cephus cinctus]|uniref:High-affinity choline transporter 1 n=1 Tax=Cephus cinctus TaxID=211228 RepID=A0AAJ7RCQ8_CEPCN|nr:high-affinity choline transporter 1 [Cephus cinctus]XP_024938010.1 high-affinity choline transporter 1 [Cephus cinctus]XP_024938011.1 high-affinity choline transporter 1 [Cephus cinctus]
MGVYVAGVAGVVVFYAAVLGVGVWAAAVKRRKIRQGQDDMLLANRGIGLFLGVFTLVATWVGGAFINGTAEAMYTKGLAWCQVPIGYSLSLFFGAILFVKPMRKAEYVTMLDPFQQRYGARVGGLLFLPALFGDLFWCGAVLSALGSSLSVVAEIDPHISVCVSAFLAAIYTIFGGLYSVACTDALQLGCIALGLAVATPFAVLHPAVSLENNISRKDWLGEIQNEDLGEWIDGMLLLIFGGIPWQGYFQRILSIKGANIARTLSIVSMFGCIALALPSALLGTVAKATDWTLVEGYNRTYPPEDGYIVLPAVLRYLTPQWVSFVGLGAISAAVMSSADSSILASSSMFARNIYRLTIRPKASERELNWILKISVLIVSFLSAAVALTVNSVYCLSYLCSDLVYVVLFPQLLSVVHWPSLVDTYGCLAAYVVAIALRISGGEKGLGLPPLIEYPFYDMHTQTQKFPFRTVAMLTGLVVQLVVSFFTRNLLGKGYFPRCCDILGVYSPRKSKDPAGVVQSSSGAALIDSVGNGPTSGGTSATTPEDNRPDYNDVVEEIEHYETVSELYETTKANNTEMVVQTANQSLMNLQNLQSIVQSSGTCRPTVPHPPNNIGAQILGVKNLTASLGPSVLPNSHGNPVGTGTLKFKNSSCTTNGVSYSKLSNIEKARENEKVIDKSMMELNLNSQEPSIMKKNIKGVKLVGMEGGTLRRPSLQGTFSPTPSVELVNILDRRQSSSSYGPSSLSPVPGVEACKTHGTAIGGQGGNEHCRIKRGIVRHHSFNDTGDRALTTLARQPTYPSMPLRSEDCRLTLVKREKKPSGIVRHSSVADEKGLGGCGIVISPTYSMYGSTIKNCNYFVADDEAVSRF